MDQKTWNSASEDGESGTGTPAAVCVLCGATEDQPPVTWTCSVEDGERRYLCEPCARTHLRSIEGRLDSAWW